MFQGESFKFQTKDTLELKIKDKFSNKSIMMETVIRFEDLIV